MSCSADDLPISVFFTMYWSRQILRASEFQSQPMQRLIVSALCVVLVGMLAATTALAQQPMQIAPSPYASAPMIVVTQPPVMQTDLGGGFIEYLFGDHASQPQTSIRGNFIAPGSRSVYISTVPANDPVIQQSSLAAGMDPQFLRQMVDYRGTDAPGTIIIDTPQHFLFLVEPDGKAMRYGIGVARPGFTWAGVHTITSKKEWPDWVPPEEMLERQPGLPHFMAGGPNNPLGARALYIGSTLYRIHGSNEPWTIGHNVSSGCIRLRNEDVIDLYDRVKVGSKVVVL
jgi:lipoprotein-anchoring transpeptidase ErfK/SrfK